MPLTKNSTPQILSTIGNQVGCPGLQERGLPSTSAKSWTPYRAVRWHDHFAGFQDARRPSEWILVEMCRTQLYFLSLRHWSIVLRDVVFIHVPGAGGALFIEEFDDHHKNITFLLPKELRQNTHGVLFERGFLDVVQLQTHALRQFLVTFERCPVTNIRVDTLTRHLLSAARRTGLFSVCKLVSLFSVIRCQQ